MSPGPELMLVTVQSHVAYICFMSPMPEATFVLPADKQLELLRGNASQPGATSPAAAVGQQPDSPQTFRPLAISEELFARWSSAAGGSGSNAAASTAGTGSSKAGSGGSRPPSRPRGGAEAAVTNTSGSQHGTSRRVSAGALSTTALGSGQQVRTAAC